MAPNFTVFHADHGITDDQMAHIQASLAASVKEDGFFIVEGKIPTELGSVPCGLYGPAMGDEPVADHSVIMEERGDRPYADRMLDAPSRPVNYVQSIGIREGTKFTLFTVYGGPLAPNTPKTPATGTLKGPKNFGGIMPSHDSNTPEGTHDQQPLRCPLRLRRCFIHGSRRNRV